MKLICKSDQRGAVEYHFPGILPVFIYLRLKIIVCGLRVARKKHLAYD